MKGIEIFRPGKHRAMNGSEIEFSEADLAATAAAYDPALHEAPLVIGHPKDNAPAWGWTRALSFAEPALTADADQVDAAFAEMVASGRFKKRSASFYPPNHPANPVPGIYYLRHIGFLGAQPPAVKGLKDIEFAEEEGLLEFSDKDQPSTKEAKNMAVKNRASFCADCGDHVCVPACPEGAIGMSADKGAVIDPAKCTVCYKCCDACQMMCGPVNGMSVASYGEQLRGKDAAIATVTAERDAARGELAASRAAARRREFESFCEALPTKISPAMRPAVVAMMTRLDGEEPVEFGEGDDKTMRSPLEIYREELKALPDVVSFAEQATKERAAGDKGRKAAADFGENVDETRLDLHNRVLEFMEENPGKSYEQALDIVQKQD